MNEFKINAREWFDFYYSSNLPYYWKLTLHKIKVLEINATQNNANLMENEFRINKINAKGEVNFTIKEINPIKTQLEVTTGTNLFQQRMTRNLKTETCAQVL